MIFNYLEDSAEETLDGVVVSIVIFLVFIISS